MKLCHKMDEVLIHRTDSDLQGLIVLGPEINTGDHGFLAFLEAVLWKDTERVGDWLRTQKSVLPKVWFILHDISGRTLFA